MRIWRRRTYLVLLGIVAALAAVAPFAWSTFQASAIRGGTDVRVGEYPWLVRVRRDLGGGWWAVCTGALVTPRHVVTAAHCTSKQVDTTSEMYAEFPVAGSPNTGRRVKVVRIERHPNARSDARNADVAVWTLARPVSVPTISLVGRGTTTYYRAGTRITVAGYGQTESLSLKQPRQIGMTVTKSCYRPISVWFCAITQDEDKGIRPGDSGSPAFVRGGNGTYLLVGVSGNHSGAQTSIARIATPLMNDWIRAKTGL